MIRDSFQRILLGILSKFFIGVNYIRDTIKNKTFFRLPFLDLPARRCGNRSFLHENIENYSKQQGYRFSTEENALVPKIAEEEEYLFDNIESLNVRSYLITPMLENLMNMSECLFITVPPKIKTDNNKVYYESVKKYKKYLNPIISKYKNVKFLETDWLYPYYNFSDAHHMNLAGAQKFTQNLKEIIQNTDCKSN